MRATFFTTLFTLLFCLSGHSQSCLPNGITFSTQAEIDNFSSNYPGCTMIEGDVTITAPGGTNITNLNGLSGIASIGGELKVYFNPLLTDLNGLNNLASVESLNIEFNWSLASLDGLEKITAINGSLAIQSNSVLTSLSGLGNITSVGGDLIMVYNTSLPSLNGLGNLTAVGGKLQFYYNAALTSMNGLGGLASVGSLSIENNPVLTSLAGLNSLATVVGEIYLTGNDNLTSLSGLSSLSSIGSLWLWYSNGLTDVNGLENITTVNGNINIQQNAALASLSGLTNLIAIGGNLWIGGTALTNLNGLNNITSIGGSLSIGGNPLLTDLSGLNNVTSVGDGLSILSNDALTNLDGLNHITAIGDVLYIDNNPLLTSLSGLASITALDSGLVISKNASLTTLSDLGNLVSMGNLNISQNASLADLNGLENITAIGGSIAISDNPVLPNLSGLKNVTSINGGLYIKANAALNSLEDLKNISAADAITIDSNDALTNLKGLESIAFISLNILKNASLTDLSSLSALDSISEFGELNISGNPALENLNGLDNLTVIEGGLVIRNNDALLNLNGLNKVKSVGGLFWIGENELLSSLSGLESLTELGPVMAIFDCPALSNLQGLNNLKTVNGAVYIERNASLTNLSGLENLTDIGDILGIDDNPALQSLQALGNLQTDLYYFWIRNNVALTSLSGLEKIVRVNGYIEIIGNTSLSNCSIFAVCNALLNEPPNSLDIFSNAPGCNSPAEAEAGCDSKPVTATVLLDENGTDTPIENIRVALSGNAQMNLRPTDANGFVRFSFLENGAFSLHLPQAPDDKWQISEQRVTLQSSTGTDSTHVVLLLTPIVLCPELMATVGLPSFFRGCLVNSEMEASAQNTGTFLAEGAKLAVVMPPVLELVTAVPLPSGQSGDTLYFELGDLKPFETAAARLTVKTKCDNFLLGQTLCIETFATLDNACPTTLPAHSEIKLSAECVNGNTVRFTVKNIGDAPTQGWHAYKIIRNDEILYDNGFDLAAQQSLSFDFPADGATWRMEATKYDDGTEAAVALENCGGLTPGYITAFWLDEGPVEYDFDCREVIGSYDPNLKSAVPIGEGELYHTIVANHPIQYTIDFQNTGTDTAFRVLLRDELPSDLDITTFRPVMASHPNTWQIRGNTLEVLFQPIALLDSNVNKAASHGFFSFALDQKPDLPDGTVFYNVTAEIVFDFNPPIYTNFVIHIIGKLTVRVDESQSHASLWRVWGNPVRDAATFRSEEFIAGEKRFELYDAAGRLVRTVQFSGQEFEFQRDLLPSGLYFFRISDEQGRMFTGKIVVAD